MKLYQYAIIYTPKTNENTGKKHGPKIIKTVTDILADDDKQVMILAARQIPEEYLDKLGDVQVAVRPF